jgi:hypothetical protein
MGPAARFISLTQRLERVCPLPHTLQLCIGNWLKPGKGDGTLCATNEAILWSDEDTAIRVRAGCICALLARRILRDIAGLTPRRFPTKADIIWLEGVFGEFGPSPNDIYKFFA